MTAARGLLALAALLCGACQGPPTQQKPGTFGFAVLGDAPYGRVEEIRFRRVIRQLDAADVRLVIHVGTSSGTPARMVSSEIDSLPLAEQLTLNQ